MELFPLFYAGNIGYYQALVRAKKFTFEQHESFPKQTFRNRIEILGPNGRQKLVIPTVKTGERRYMRNVQIAYGEDWQKDHWKSLEAAYRRSPYFEFYEDRLKPFYFEETISLLQFNLNLFDVIDGMLGLDLQWTLTGTYEEPSNGDYRAVKFPVAEGTEPYMQVFGDRHPFQANLSVLDALFNLGPRARELMV